MTIPTIEGARYVPPFTFKQSDNARQYVVRSGENLQSIAAAHSVKEADILAANPQVAHPSRIYPGDVLVIPQPSTSGKGDKAVDDAARVLQEKQSNLDTIRKRAAGGDGMARAELSEGYLQQDVSDAERGFESAVISRLSDERAAGADTKQLATVAASIEKRHPQANVSAIVREASGDEQTMQGADGALAELHKVQGELNQLQNAAAKGDDNARAALRSGAPQQRVADATAASDRAIDAEVQRRTQAGAIHTSNEDVRANIIARNANNTFAPTAVTAVAGYDARQTLSNIDPSADAATRLTSLNDAFVKGDDAFKTALMSEPGTAKILTDAAEFANEPLARLAKNDDPAVLPFTSEAMSRLEVMTRDLDPQLAARLAETALPAYEAVAQRPDVGTILGANGTRAAVVIADRVWSAPGGERLVERFVDLGTNVMMLNEPLGEGVGPAYLLEVGKRPGAMLPGGQSPFDASLDGARLFSSRRVASDAQAYTEHLEELGFLTRNAGTTMSAEQLDAAIEQYIADRGPEWTKNLDGLKERLADDGALLLNTVQQLHNGVAQLPPAERPQRLEAVAALLGEPHAELAVGLALSRRPELARGAAGTNLVDTFTALGIKGKDNRLAASLVDAYLRENVINPAANVDFSNPASLHEARQQLDTALRGNPGIATLLDVSPQQLDAVTGALLDLLPEKGVDVTNAEYVNDIARTANNSFDRLSEALGRDTPFGRGFRVSAVAIVSSGLVNAIDRFGETPSLRNGLDMIVESARVGVDSAQLWAAMRGWPEGPAVSGLKSAGRVVHLLGAGMGVYGAANSLAEGDYLGAGLNAAAAGGVAWAALGSSSAAGPVGFGIAAVATVGLMINDAVRTANRNSRYETDTTATFLKSAGFTDEAARALIDQSGEGHSPAPLLMRYGELRGMTRERTVEWINAMTPEQLASLRDNVHHTLDEIGGDPGRFPATASDDAHKVNFILAFGADAYHGVAYPQSAAQLDAVVQALNIPRATPA